MTYCFFNVLDFFTPALLNVYIKVFFVKMYSGTKKVLKSNSERREGGGIKPFLLSIHLYRSIEFQSVHSFSVCNYFITLFSMRCSVIMYMKYDLCKLVCISIKIIIITLSWGKVLGGRLLRNCLFNQRNVLDTWCMQCFEYS